jgi:hypothetical protein
MTTSYRPLYRKHRNPGEEVFEFTGNTTMEQSMVIQESVKRGVLTRYWIEAALNDNDLPFNEDCISEAFEYIDFCRKWGII